MLSKAGYLSAMRLKALLGPALSGTSNGPYLNLAPGPPGETETAVLLRNRVVNWLGMEMRERFWSGAKASSCGHGIFR